MNTTQSAIIPDVTCEQVAAYRDDGFLVVEKLIGADELELLKADALKLARGGYPSPHLQPLPEDIGDEEALRRILCIHQPQFASPVVRSFVTHPAIAAHLERIVNAHLPAGWWDGAVKCMQSMFFVKPPGKPGQAWRQDEAFIRTRDRSLCGAWIAVDDATVANGCLWVLPGSHRSGVLYPQRKHDKPDFDFAAEAYGFDDGDEIPVEVPAGSVVFFNGYLLHRSKPNRSDIYRRALVNHYMSAQSFLPWHPKEGEAGARCDERSVIMAAGEDPYPWKGFEEPAASCFLRQDPTAQADS